MVKFLFGFSTSLVQFIIFSKYLKCFSKTKRISKASSIAIVILFSGVLSFVNYKEISIMNLLFSIVLIVLFSLQYKLTPFFHFFIPLLYSALNIAIEPVVGLFNIFISISSNSFFVKYESYYIPLISQSIVFIIVLIFSRFWNFYTTPLPHKPAPHLLIFPIASIILCPTIALFGSKNPNRDIVLLCMIFVLVILFYNIYTFYSLELYAKQKKKENDYIILEKDIKIKEQNYKQLFVKTQELQKFKHDIKNKLLWLSNISIHKEIAVKEGLEKIIGNIENSKEIIYSLNNELNTVINVKQQEARKHNIEFNCNILSAREMKLDYGDMGVLVGNSLDNSIEACLQMNNAHKWIKIIIRCLDNNMMLNITNSKNDSNNNIPSPEKAEIFSAHGYGILGIKEIVKKYEGYVEFIDTGHTYEVSAILYNVITNYDE